MKVGRKLSVLGGLYLAQGLPFGFFTQALPVLLRQAGVSLEAIGMSSWLALPWGMKFLWAPLVDRIGTRRAWIVGLQATGVALCALLAGMSPSGTLWVLAGAVLLTNFVAATQDIGTDGLAVSWLAPEERGWGNGLQVAGYRVGMILGGGALLLVFERWGWTATLGAMAIGLALATVPLLLSPGVGTERVEVERTTLNPWDWVGLPGAWRWAAVLIAFKFGDYTVGGMMRPWLVDAGWSAGDLGVLLGGAGFGAGLAGAVIGGALVQPLGRKRALIGFGFLQSLGLSGYVAAAWLGAGVVPVTVAVVGEHLLGGMATAALFTAMMDASREEHAGTDYTVQASIVVWASGMGASASGWVAGSAGYLPTFALGTALSLLGPLLAWRVAAPGRPTVE